MEKLQHPQGKSKKGTHWLRQGHLTGPRNGGAERGPQRQGVRPGGKDARALLSKRTEAVNTLINNSGKERGGGASLGGCDIFGDNVVEKAHAMQGVGRN